jgi:hypothetical protein
MIQRNRASRRRVLCLAAVVATLAAGAAPAGASFHLMQIEQVIGGVCGDTTQQAIQLRMRTSGQNLLGGARLRVVDATGANPIVIKDFTASVANGANGAHVLVQSHFFDAAQNPDPDVLLTTVIPATYLPAGRLTFETDGAGIYWSLSWGGAGYTGPTTGDPNHLNDLDGEFGPSFPGPLPWTTGQALQFEGGSADLSTNNAADYSLTAGDAIFVNNSNSDSVLNSNNCVFGDRFETGGTTGWSSISP